MRRILIITVVVLLIGGIIGTAIYLLRKPKITTPTGSTSSSTPADGLQTNPGSGNPQSDPGGYILKIGDPVYNRGTQTISLYTSPGYFGITNDPNKQNLFAPNEYIGIIQEIFTDGKVKVKTQKGGTGLWSIPIRDWYVAPGTSNSLGL